jgi:hypothetical protein
MAAYPLDLLKFDTRFATEEGCRDYLLRIRWPSGFRCPSCEGTKAWPQRRVWLHCASCGRQSSVTAGTIFQDAHQPLTLWFRALWYMSRQRTKATAMGLKRDLGLHSYHVAWTWFQKLRSAMTQPPRLRGWVEADDVYLGREVDEENRVWKETLIAAAAEADDEEVGRIRLRQIPDRTKVTLHAFVADCIKPGSTVHTDGALGYHDLDGQGYVHKTGVVELKTGRESLPNIDLVMSKLRPWLSGAGEGVLRYDRLPYYLDAFTFRFNWRKSRDTGKLFYELVEQAVATSPTSYRTIVEATRSQRSDGRQRDRL